MTLKRLLAGAAAGLAATLPMTWAMAWMHRRLPPAERYPPPPEEIVDVLVADAGLEPTVTPGRHAALTLLAHYGYGAGAGAAFAALTRPDAPRPAARGILFGLLLWAGSYGGWLPALHILTPATRHPWRRNVMMITSHAIWGAVIGALLAPPAANEST